MRGLLRLHLPLGLPALHCETGISNPVALPGPHLLRLHLPPGLPPPCCETGISNPVVVPALCHDTQYEVKFRKEFVDLRADLDLLPRGDCSGSCALAIEDGEVEEECEMDSEAAGDRSSGDSEAEEEAMAEEMEDFVRKRMGGNPLDVVYDVVRFMGDMADLDDICDTAAMADITSDVAKQAVSEWVGMGILRELRPGVMAMNPRVGPWEG